ncbi:hypothetical protein GCM10007853_17180 [Algimonas ampicilliniresistens]|uniref:DUF736 domain-containing protein n=1 Tax=Algimonas ampicilliniresistens TaxID=1298735 RepID=A0ABQ5VA23_9PROT|nr:DUF736 domain-containing protein [Algimonas ampicilliniresistens]GLQ23844.1 hypothetical protein GCM10007853_17180 [Algimonas ampicilliniresistens]
MATIGQFRIKDDGYEGTISTLTMARKVRLVLNTNKKHDDSPDYFVKTGQCDLGFARKAVAKGEEGQPYLKVFLDDPSFAAPVWAAMFEADGKADLVWSRPKSH